ncbi:hypothetical protein HPB52_002817 [Rhipicephalus sanguineus]|uniref:Tick transposon n=1 Tax=Rhipicephalus sanguineus TaxID=34632 RepID=A0A9D4Q9D5_RHISA|nr:hypothetical protein HPB52_002817 [Rhipicephalus sanguineus]
MHPVHNRTRRRARAQALVKAANLHATDVAFVDAAKYVDKPYFAAAAVAPDGTALNALTIQTQKGCEVEQVAIALALALPQRDTIFTDSKPAALAYGRGAICQAALSILESAQINVDKHIHWFPGHEGLKRFNQDLTRRAGTRAGSPAGDPNTHREPLLSYHEICSHYNWINQRRSPDRALQHPAVQKAQKVAGELRLPVPTWAEPPDRPP